MALEDRIGKRAAHSHASIGTDKLSLKVTPDGKGLLMLTAASAAAGATDAGAPLNITFANRLEIRGPQHRCFHYRPAEPQGCLVAHRL
jgi:hypothetical protein